MAIPTAITDWVTAKSNFDTASSALTTAQATYTTELSDLAIAKTALESLVSAEDPIKVYNTSGTTVIVVQMVGASVLVRTGTILT